MRWPVVALLVLVALAASPALPADDAAYRLASARTLENRGQLTAAIVERLWADQALHRIEQRDHNDHQIWRLLQRLPSTALNAPPAAAPWTAEGWWALARSYRDHATSHWDLARTLDAWARRYPDHPARDSILRTLQVDLPPTQPTYRHVAPRHAVRPQRIAVVVPTSGPLGDAGRALADALLDAARAAPDLSIRLFDSGAGDSYSVYQAAAQYGPDLIVGPLDKSTVEVLSRQGRLLIPTLALNYGSSSAWSAGNLWQFGLAPEDDAAAAAAQAIQAGRRRAAILFSDDDWGRRVGLGFLEHYEALGGEVIDQASFWAGSDDLQAAVQHLLQPDATRPLWQDTRPGRLAGSRRIDMLFLAAKSRDARLLVPLLRFHHAVDLPVYAPDAALSARRDQEAINDLRMVLLCGPRDNNGEAGDFAQFSALGRDAFAVATQLPALESGQEIQGATGRLSLATGGQVRRRATCSPLRP
ncbi:penicillin-binding protein activator [uncultured Abyssibacter sp.]|uniref:penicillin-binding protein activator n=1 Tax=uncultured Abyssibacter sp. TaxID=2320202 RepID=UPI0032B2CC92